MRFFLLAGAALRMIGVLAAPSPSMSNDLNEVLRQSDLYARDDTGADGYNDNDGKDCLLSSCAQQVADNFRALIVNYTESLANEVLTSNFTDYSDSINELMNGGCPNTTPLVCLCILHPVVC